MTHETRLARHNRLATEFGVKLFEEVPDLIDKLIVLESVCFVTFAMHMKRDNITEPGLTRAEGCRRLAKILHESLLERIDANSEELG